jgi:hypothetical protein
MDAGLPLVDRVGLIINGHVLGDGRNLNEATFVTFDVVNLKRRDEVKVLTALQDGLGSEARAAVETLELVVFHRWRATRLTEHTGDRELL